MSTQPRQRSSESILLSLLLLGGGAALWIGATWRDPNALSMLPGLEGCVTVAIVGALLALLHGIPYRTTVFFVAVPIALVQLAVTRWIYTPFAAALGVEMTVVGLFGLPFYRLRSGSQRGGLARSR